VKSLLLVLIPATATAGGMVLPIHGVHDTERAGALIAGSEDPDSLWLDPAGLAHLREGTAVLVDAAYVDQRIDYARIDSGDNQLAAVSNQYPGIAVPTLAAAYRMRGGLVLAGGVTAPYAGIGKYDGDATRYSSISLAESAFVNLTVGAAYSPLRGLRLGVTATDTITMLKSQVALSGCPGQTICAPEDPDFDARTKVDATDLFAPSVGAGIQYDVTPRITLAASGTTPTYVRAHGTVATQLPSSAYFEGAMVMGDQIDVSFTLPATTKFGIEVRPDDHLRIEAALDVEYWSEHKAMKLTTTDVYIANAAGVGMYQLSPITIPRHYKTSYAPSIGGEYRLGKLQVGAGYSYETAAAPKAYVSAMTVDSAKHIIGLGGGYTISGWDVGAAFAFVKLADVDLSLADARVPQLTPLRDQPSEIYVNAGQYRSTYLVGGVRASRRF
jgi:long-chain fatty acid transport protein